jgi:signal transduction histidine kinase
MQAPSPLATLHNSASRSTSFSPRGEARQSIRNFAKDVLPTRGLGLSIAKQIITAHGGQIGFDPVMPHGAAFYVDLPTRSPYV